MRSSFSALILATLVSCGGDKDETDTGAVDGDADTDADSDADSDTDTDTDAAGGIVISGTARNVQPQGPAAEGLCVDLVDPSPVVTGSGPPIVLDTVTVGAGGAFAFADVTTDSIVGLLMSVKDCDAPGTTVYTTATGIQVAELATGEDLTDRTAFSIDNAMLAGLAASATAAGYAGDLAADGFMFGFVFDNAGAPVAGATVTCDNGCGPTFYLDADPAEGGLFASGSPPTLNSSTIAAAGAAWLIPAGPVGRYIADDGGTHTFAEQLNGSTPGSATATAFIAQ